MGAIFSTVLITAPLAFMVGWLVSKAVFRHLSVVRPRGVVSPVQQRASEMPPPQAKPDIPGRSNDQQIALLEQRLEIAQADKRAALNEVQLLRESVAEHEQRQADLQEQLRLAYLPPEDTAANSTELQNVKHSKDLRELRAKIDKNEKEIAGLRHELIAAEQRIDKAKARFAKWRERGKPVVRQVRQQKVIIAELRDEMRRREQEQSVKTATPPPVAPSGAEPRPVAELRDDLEQLRGVGPALHAKLNDKGIYRLEQLADMSGADLRRLGRSLGISERQLARHDWQTQAGSLLGRSSVTSRDDTAGVDQHANA